MKFFTIALFGLLATVLTIMPEMAFAQVTGEGPLNDIAMLMAGNMGTLIGLGIAVFGLYMWLVQQASWGIMMIIGGVAITAFPGLFSSMQEGFQSAFDTSGATADQQTVLP